MYFTYFVEIINYLFLKKLKENFIRNKIFFYCLGEPPQTGTATVRIYTKNKNDEEPKFSQQVYTPNVDENAGPNTLVTTVVASDKDGDNVKYVI